MSAEPDNITRRSSLNLLIFILVYSALAITEKQVIRKGYLGFQLPIKLGVMEVIAGLVAGSILVLAVTALSQKGSQVLRVLLIGSFLLGAIYLNFFLFKFYYPPFVSLNEGDLDSLGASKWTNTYPYQMYAGAYQKYYLSSIRINPGTSDYAELSRLERFGFTIIPDLAIPTTLDSAQFASLEDELGSAYQSGSAGDLSYRFYDISAGEQLAFASYQNLVLFIPLDSLRP